MLEMLMQWYRRPLATGSDSLVGYFGSPDLAFFFFSGLLAPFSVAIVLAYLSMAAVAPAIYWLLPPLGDSELYWWFLSVYCC